MRDKRGSWSGRGDSRRRSRRLESLLDETTLEGLDERLGTRKTRHTERRRPGDKPGLSLTHVAFLLLGLAIGATALALVHFTGHRPAPSPAPEPAAGAARPQPKPKPQPKTEPDSSASSAQGRPISSDDPTAIVRAMLQSALDKDKATAFAYWGLKPTDVAFTGAGLQATLEECIDLAGRSANAVKPSQAEFRLDARTGETARVGQYVNGICTQIYTLKRQGGQWRIINATLP